MKRWGSRKEPKTRQTRREAGMGARHVTRAAAAEGVGDKEVENEKTPERTGSGRCPERAKGLLDG
jgi:hypothetical protein